MRFSGCVGIFCLGLISIATSRAEIQPDQLEFFEKRIRPVLVESCYPCHSVESGKSKGGLHLDSASAVLRGGENGPAIVPGEPEASRLIRAIRYTDSELQMPPGTAGSKLDQAKIDDLTGWVAMGAPDPRAATGSTPLPASSLERAREHWALQPIRAPALPTVKKRSWVRTPVDAFVLANLETRAMRPASPADRRTLLRRLTYDLTGLPPTPRETGDFLEDRSEDAYERVVERLLASPRYGERWGRHWLDVARYADTKGYVFQEERRYPYAYTYRDYVIRAFNDDKPYDRFLIEQLAADQLELGENKSPLAALGYLTLGRRFLNNQNDIIDDRIDVVTRGMLGLTVTCARCHDHKFDPIPTEDYYSLHGVFASSREPEEKPLLGPLPETDSYRDFLKERAEIEAREAVVVRKEVEEFRSEARAKSGEYLLAAHDAGKRDANQSLEDFAGTRKLTGKILERWMSYLEARSASNDPVLAPWFTLAALDEDGFVDRANELAASWVTRAETAPPRNRIVVQALADQPPADLKQAASLYQRLLKETEEAWKHELDEAAKAGGTTPTALPDPDREALRSLLYAEGAPANPESEEVERLIRRKIQNETVKFRQELEALNWKHPGAPARAMALEDKESPTDSHVLIRGNPGNRGPEVPRRFLALLAGSDREPFSRGSGRLDLAESIASPDNPLTARVWVNRVWDWHFARPLMPTPSDFGVRTEAPVQLDLLNWLAATFIQEGWSVKKLHRLIVLSNTYRQSSDASPRYAALDPENQYLHRFNRQRLDFEALRDTLLAVSGRLDTAMGGQPVDILEMPSIPRRTVYGFIDRQNLPGVFRTFDFANPDASSPGRFDTTVPQQALFLLNSPFVIEQARTVAKSEELQSCANDTERIRTLYRVLQQREPDRDEIRLAGSFLEQVKANPAPEPAMPAWRYGFGTISSNSSRVDSFELMKEFKKDRATPTDQYPDPGRFGHLSVTEEGGHTGPTVDLASIRRWIAPADGVIRIEGTLGHSNEQGDGVRGRLIVESGGSLGEWVVHNRQAETTIPALAVRTGTTIDFVVDCIGGTAFDSFTWAPRISYTETADENLDRRAWNAKSDFAPPAKPIQLLDRWEQLAQVLLLSNELAFVD